MSISEISAVSQLPLRRRARITPIAARAFGPGAVRIDAGSSADRPRMTGIGGAAARGDGHGRQDGAEQPAQAGAPAGPRAPRAAYALAGDERRALTHVGERRRPGSRRDETARHLLAEDPDLVLERHREV